MGHEHMRALNSALRELRATWGRQTPKVESVFGDTVTLRSTMRETTPEQARPCVADMVGCLRRHGVQVIDAKAEHDRHARSVADVVLSVSVPDYVTESVDIEFNPGTEWGYTGRGHTINTMWENADGFVILEISTGAGFLLPIKRAAGPKAIERSVRARLALYYRMVDMRKASEEDTQELQDTPDTPTGPAPGQLPVAGEALEMIEPVYTGHLAQPDQPSCGPLLFCAPPPIDADDF